TAGLQCGCQGGRGVYIRAERSSLPPRASDMLAVRIGQLTAEVFHLLDLQPCWLLRTSLSVNSDHPLPHPELSSVTGAHCDATISLGCLHDCAVEALKLAHVAINLRGECATYYLAARRENYGGGGVGGRGRGRGGPGGCVEGWVVGG